MLSLDDLQGLHADSVKAADLSKNLWMSNIDAVALDKLITEMNEMNRWFAKV